VIIATLLYQWFNTSWRKHGFLKSLVAERDLNVVQLDDDPCHSGFQQGRDLLWGGIRPFAGGSYDLMGLHCLQGRGT
jgi:hypothetical protein